MLLASLFLLIRVFAFSFLSSTLKLRGHCCRLNLCPYLVGLPVCFAAFYTIILSLSGSGDDFILQTCIYAWKNMNFSRSG